VVELDDLTVVLGKLPALMSRTELELSLHDLDEQRGSSIERAQNRPFGFDSSASDGTVKRPTAPESAAGLEAVLGPDRTIRLCHVRGAAIVALSGHPGTQCIRRAARTPLVVTSVHAFIWPFSRAARRPCSGRALYAPQTPVNHIAGAKSSGFPVRLI